MSIIPSISEVVEAIRSRKNEIGRSHTIGNFTYKITAKPYVVIYLHGGRIGSDYRDRVRDAVVGRIIFKYIRKNNLIYINDYESVHTVRILIYYDVVCKFDLNILRNITYMRHVTIPKVHIPYYYWNEDSYDILPPLCIHMHPTDRDNLWCISDGVFRCHECYMFPDHNITYAIAMNKKMYDDLYVINKVNEYVKNDMHDIFDIPEIYIDGLYIHYGKHSSIIVKNTRKINLQTIRYFVGNIYIDIRP